MNHFETLSNAEKARAIVIAFKLLLPIMQSRGACNPAFRKATALHRRHINIVRHTFKAQGDTVNNNFLTWLGTLPLDEQYEVLQQLRELGAELGVTIDEVPAEDVQDDQAAIDAAFAQLMEGIDL